MHIKMQKLSEKQKERKKYFPLIYLFNLKEKEQTRTCKKNLKNEKKYFFRIQANKEIFQILNLKEK